MKADFTVSSIVPTSDGTDQIHLTPKAADTDKVFRRIWPLSRPHGIEVGDSITVEVRVPPTL
jgi:hypothetical protein